MASAPPQEHDPDRLVAQRQTLLSQPKDSDAALDVSMELEQLNIVLRKLMPRITEDQTSQLSSTLRTLERLNVRADERQKRLRLRK